jgi:hypothetical protein
VKTANGQPAITTEALLENSGYLPPHAAAKIRQLRDEYAQQGYMDDASYEELASKIRQVIALEGGLHFEGIGELIRKMSAALARPRGFSPSYLFA